MKHAAFMVCTACHTIISCENCQRFTLNEELSPVLTQCWPSVGDAGTALGQHQDPAAGSHTHSVLDVEWTGTMSVSTISPVSCCGVITGAEVTSIYYSRTDKVDRFTKTMSAHFEHCGPNARGAAQDSSSRYADTSGLHQKLTKQRTIVQLCGVENSYAIFLNS